MSKEELMQLLKDNLRVDVNVETGSSFADSSYVRVRVSLYFDDEFICDDSDIKYSD